MLLSVDSFHQETIPLDIVKYFAMCIKESGVEIKLNPAWLVSKEDDNEYNKKTKKIISEFEDLNISLHFHRQKEMLFFQMEMQ